MARSTESCCCVQQTFAAVPLCTIPQKNVKGKPVGDSCFARRHSCSSGVEIRKHHGIRVKRLADTRSSVPVRTSSGNPAPSTRYSIVVTTGWLPTDAAFLGFKKIAHGVFHPQPSSGQKTKDRIKTNCSSINWSINSWSINSYSNSNCSINSWSINNCSNCRWSNTR